MRVDYKKEIQHTVDQLLALEKKAKTPSIASRLAMLRLLKSGQVTSINACAPILGYCERHLRRCYAIYRTEGIEAFMQTRQKGHRSAMLTEAAREQLQTEMIAGRIATLSDVRAYLNNQFGIQYRSLSGVWRQLHKHRIRKKTGRRRHRKADAAAQEAFKKTSPRP